MATPTYNQDPTLHTAEAEPIVHTTIADTPTSLRTQPLNVDQARLHFLADQATKYRELVKEAKTSTKKKYFTKKLTQTTTEIIQLLVRHQTQVAKA